MPEVSQKIRFDILIESTFEKLSLRKYQKNRDFELKKEGPELQDLRNRNCEFRKQLK